jgi:predicted molibdopterin-dependent oxidoreductase YjgC
MSEIRLTINGQEVTGQAGQTILEVCQDHGIHVPTLCHCPGLTNVGACRMCVVEVEGDRRLNTACTTPAREGMVVRTDTEHLRKMRLMTLELLFSERNHICPFCAQSGHCELQDLGYELGMIHPRYPYLYPKLVPDTSSPYFVMEPNRCILCGRCVRACDEIAGVHTLDFGQRGSREMIVADMGVPIGESSCIACGSCVEVCPTGALFEKRNAYWVRERNLPTVVTTCPACSVGCRFAAALKPGLIVRHESVAEAPVNGRLLCQKGRFQLLEEERPRLLNPLVRQNGSLEETGWDEALGRITETLRLVDRPGRVGGFISARLPNETLYLFQRLLRQVIGTDKVATLDAEDLQTRQAAVHQFLGQGTAAAVECGLEEVAQADAFLVVGADLRETHPVVAAWIAKAIYQRQTPLVVIDPRPTQLGEMAEIWLKPRRRHEGIVLNGLLNALAPGARLTEAARSSLAVYTPERVAQEAQIPAADLSAAAQILAQAQAPLILYGEGLTRYGDPGLIVTLMNLALANGRVTDGRLRVRGLTREANSTGALSLGMLSDFDLAHFDPQEVECLYLVVGDAECSLEESVMDRLNETHCLIVQASHQSEWTERADVVLPDLAWWERAGTFMNTDGRLQSVQPVLPPPAGVKDDMEIFAALASACGAELPSRVDAVQKAIADQMPAFREALAQLGTKVVSEAPDLSRVDLRVVRYL